MRALKDYKKGGTCYDCKHIRDSNGELYCIEKEGFSFDVKKKRPLRIMVANKRNSGFLIETKCKDDFEMRVK